MYPAGVIPQEPVRGRFIYLEHPGLLSLPGLEQMRVFLDRPLPPPPPYHLTGLRVSAPQEAGLSTFEMPATGWLRSGAGPFLGGTYAFLADVALGSAIYAHLPAGTWLATSEMSINYLRPATPSSEKLLARAEVIQVGTEQGLSQARVEDARGRLLAHVTSRNLVRPLPFEAQPAPEPSELPAFDFDDPGGDPPDPFRRDPGGVVVPQEAWDESPGIEILRRWCKEDVEGPPVCALFGMRVIGVDEGSTTWTMPASEWFCTSGFTFYGGALVMLLDGAVNGAVTSTLGPGDSHATLDLKVNFLRPVSPDGRDLTARAEVVHRGRTIQVVRAQIENADRKTVAVATSSAMMLPSRPWMRLASSMDEAPVDG